MRMTLVLLMFCFISSQAGAQSAVNTAASAPTSGTQESASSALEQFRHIGKEELGTAILKMANADVEFPSRRDWEQSLFEAKQEWQDQVDRMMAHQDSNQSVKDTGIGLTRKAQLNFESVRKDGIQKARAVSDPVLKAHLQYEQQLDSCKQTSGDCTTSCLYNAEMFKYQMQREGAW